MLFTIVFNEYGLTLDTTDMETAFHACDMPQLVEAVINAETGKVLWGSLERPMSLDMTKTKVGGITKANKDTASKCWSYPHPIATDATIYKFDAPFVLEVKVYNKETGRLETLCYELDGVGCENAMKDVQTMFTNKCSDWTRTKRILFAKFYANKNGNLIHECSVYFPF